MPAFVHALCARLRMFSAAASAERRSWAGLVVVLLGLALLAWRTERMFDVTSVARVGIALCLFVSLASVIWMLGRRPRLAVAAALAVVLSLGALSKIKFDYLGATLHALDLYFYLGAPVETVFFAIHQPAVAALGALGVVLLVAAIVWQWRREQASHLPRLAALPLAVLPLLPASHYAASPRLQEQMLHGHFYDGYHLTSWFVSAFNPIDDTALARYFPTAAGNAARAPAAQALSVRFTTDDPSGRTSRVRRPNVILILHESTIDPRPFRPEERTRFDVDPFVSADGATRKLIVETFGGRTWITENGALLGLSTHYFKPNQTFMSYLLEGKFRNALPHAMQAHGYGTTHVLPDPAGFVNMGRFLKTLGFETIRDLYDQNPPTYSKRDRDYFNLVVDDIAARRTSGDARPVFSFVLTASTHFPWNKAYFPDVRASEIVPGDPWAEFSRRVRIAHDDYEAFKARLAREFPDEAFLLVGFGDHHPTLTAPFIADTDPKSSPRYETYYRLDAINFSPDFAAAPDRIEVGYLANVIQAAARLPLDQSFRRRQEVMRTCAGLMYRCADQEKVIDLHRFLVERGDVLPTYARSR